MPNLLFHGVKSEPNPNLEIPSPSSPVRTRNSRETKDTSSFVLLGLICVDAAVADEASIDPPPSPLSRRGFRKDQGLVKK